MILEWKRLLTLKVMGYRALKTWTELRFEVVSRELAESGCPSLRYLWLVRIGIMADEDESSRSQNPAAVDPVAREKRKPRAGPEWLI
jgi:hypothetical protein